MVNAFFQRCDGVVVLIENREQLQIYTFRGPSNVHTVCGVMSLLKRVQLEKLETQSCLLVSFVSRRTDESCACAPNCSCERHRVNTIHADFLYFAVYVVTQLAVS